MSVRRRGWTSLAWAVTSAAIGLHLRIGPLRAQVSEEGSSTGGVGFAPFIPPPVHPPAQDPASVPETRDDAVMPPSPPASPPSPPLSEDAGRGPELGGGTSISEPGAPEDAPDPDPDASPAAPRATGSTRVPPRRVPRPPPAIAHAANEVAIRLMVEPSGVAHVFWGVKDLGPTSAEIIRPRDSGPLDLSLRAPGYLTFHTRAYTDRDDKIAIRMVPVMQAARVFGYRPGGNSDPRSGKSPDSNSAVRRENPSDRGTKRWRPDK